MILTRKNRRTLRKTCPSVTLSTTNPIWTDPGANPGLRSGRPATNRLRHGTAELGTYPDKKRRIRVHENKKDIEKNNLYLRERMSNQVRKSTVKSFIFRNTIYESQNLLGYTAMFLIGCRPTFQWCVLPPSGP
jgi:hypothetical protein